MNRSIELTCPKQGRPIVLDAIAVGVLFGVFLASGHTLAVDRPAEAAASPQQQEQRLELMKSKGADATLTILPVRVAGKPFDRVTEVVGALLEQQGLNGIELATAACDPGSATDMAHLSSAVCEFVKEHPIATEYALYAEFNGNMERHELDASRTIVVDRSGDVVWTDELTGKDEALKSLQDHPDLMNFSVVLTQRLGSQLGLNEETAKAAKPGKMAHIMEQRSGLPPEAERAPLADRQKRMQESRNSLTLMIFPTRIGGDTASVESAADLAKLINDAKLCNAVPATQTVVLKASQADPNEQKALWDLAREFREYVRNNRPDADYVLYADYVFNPKNWEQGLVHFVVCDRQGEWVIVDYQNSHHPDYQSIQPVSRNDCDRLLVKRLGEHLQ